MNAERLLQHFERLSEAPDTIMRLRRFILDLAVRGKLVEQDPNDEPATELLKRIQAEKARLVKEGKIRGQGPLRPVNNADLPFAVPRYWAWLPLREIGALSGGIDPIQESSTTGRRDQLVFTQGHQIGRIGESELKLTSAGVAETGLPLLSSREPLYGGTKRNSKSHLSRCNRPRQSHCQSRLEGLESIH